MDKTLSLAIACLVITATVSAHPGVGIVVDRKGNVYYTDLRHVWKMKPDGTTAIVVRNVHTHELYVDIEDNVYGEHLWFEGERTDRWGHRIWKLTPEGRVIDVIPPREGFRDDYDDFHFARDGRGAMYWADREDQAIRMRVPGKEIHTLVRAPFQTVRQMTVTPDGTVFLIDLFDLVTHQP